jgi:hypothetical protein
MSSNKDKPPGKPGSGSGGVKHDDRGNAIWQWAVDSGKFALDSTSRLLKRLEVPDLKIEDHAAPAEPKATEKPGPGKHPAAMQKVDPKAGYDPYGGASSAAARPDKATRPAAITKPAAASSARPSLLNRLFRKD